MKKVWLLALMPLLLVACPGKEKNQAVELPPSRFEVNANEPSYKLQKEEGEILWYVNFIWFGNRDGSDMASQKIKLDTNTTIRFISGDDDRLNQMIASGDMPDIITVDKANVVAKSAERWAIPLNKLADAYDPYFYQVAKPESLAWYTDESGNVYGYPSMSNGYDDFLKPENKMVGEHAFIVRSDIYKAIGSPDMSTPEGFLQALRDANAYDPSLSAVLGVEKIGEGGGAGVDVVMNFLGIPRIVDGKYNERLFDEEYLLWLDVLRQAHQEGFIIDDNFTWKTDDGYIDLANQGKFFAIFVGALPGMAHAVVRNAQRDPSQTYIAIDGPRHRNGNPPRFYTEQTGISGWTQTFVTKQAKDKERAIQLITYLLSKEGHFATNLGVEGETYFLDDDGIYRFTPEYAKWRAEDNDAFQKATQFGEFWMIADPSFKVRYTDTQTPEMRQIYDWTRGKLYPEFAIENTDPEPRSAASRTLLQYTEERNDAVARMLKAKSKEDMMVELEKLRTLYMSDKIQEAYAVKNANIAKNIERLNLIKQD